MEQFLDTAVRAARAAGAIQRERLWKELAIDFKGEFDLVTEVDRLSEETIIAIIGAAYPDHGFLAEEGGGGRGSSDHLWVIDPLDGTTNYAHGFPWFAVSIALEVAGEVVLGVVYQPVLDELFTAVKGEGAFRNGQRLHVSTTVTLANALLATGFPYERRDGENNLDHFCNFHPQARGIRRAGAAALDLAYVAAGRLDGFWEIKLKPWDLAAGTLLVREAGGTVSNFAGEPHSIHDHRVLADNGLIHGEMLEVLNRGDRR